MSKHDQIISALSRLPIFTGLDQQKILKMLKACQKESFKTGKVLFYQGEESDKMYILTKGEVQVVVNEVPITRVSGVTSFGECGIFTQEKRNATLKITDKSSFLVLSNEKLTKILEEDIDLNNAVSMNVSKIVNEKIKNNNTVMISVINQADELQKQLKVLETQIVGRGKVDVTQEMSEEEIDAIVLNMVKIPTVQNGSVSFFNYQGIKQVRAINKEYFLCDYSEKMAIHNNLNLEGLLFLGGRRPLQFSAVVIAMKETTMLLKILEINEKFAFALESVQKKFGVV